MADNDLLSGAQKNDSYINSYEENKKLPPVVKIVLLSIAAIAVVVGVIYAIMWYNRPTVEELKSFNTVENLLFEKKSMYLHSDGSDGIYLIRGDAYTQTAMSHYNSDKFSLDLEYDGKRYVVDKDGETVYCFLSQTDPTPLSVYGIGMHFSSIDTFEYNKRPSVEDGKYVYVSEKKIGSNTLKRKFVFNKDMSVSQIYMDDILVFNIDYNVEKNFFEPLKKYDLKDTVEVDFINMYDPIMEYKTFYVPRGMSVTGSFLSFDPKNPDAERPSESLLEIYLDKECLIPVDETTRIEENTTLYLNLPDIDRKAG